MSPEDRSAKRKDASVQIFLFQNPLIIDNVNNYHMDTCFFIDCKYIYKISFDNYMS